MNSQTKNPLGAYTQEEIANATKLLRNPDLLNLAIQQTEKSGHVGESINKRTLYLSYTSRLFKEAVSNAVKGESAAGKNALVEAVLALFPESVYLSYTTVTAKALYYIKNRDLSHKILIIFEAHGSEAADYPIRSSISEGKLKILVTVKNPLTGVFESVEIEIPAEGLVYIETTTKSSLHPENQTRFFDIYIDESEQQTRKIFRAQSKPIDLDAVEKENRVFRVLQLLLKPYEVYIPFGDILAEKFPASKTRGRRDYPRFLVLIKASALLHQYQRNTTTIHGREFLIATVEDYSIAYEIAKVILSQTLKGVTPSEDKVLHAVKKVFPTMEFSIGELKINPSLKNMPDSTLRKAVTELTKKGHFEWNGEKGRKSRYELVDVPKDIFSLPSPQELVSLIAQSQKSQSSQVDNSANGDLAEYSSISPKPEDSANELNQAKNQLSSTKSRKPLDNSPSSHSANQKTRLNGGKKEQTMVDKKLGKPDSKISESGKGKKHVENDDSLSSGGEFGNPVSMQILEVLFKEYPRCLSRGQLLRKMNRVDIEKFDSSLKNLEKEQLIIRNEPTFDEEEGKVTYKMGDEALEIFTIAEREER